jgi:hypothetical protein
MTTVHAGPRAVQPEIVAFDDRPMPCEDPDAPTAEDLAWYAGLRACEEGGETASQESLPPSLQSCWMAGWTYGLSELARSEAEGKAAGLRGALGHPDPSAWPGYETAARWRKGRGEGLIIARAASEAYILGFESGGLFESKLAPAHLSVGLRAEWYRGYDAGRSAVEEEAVDSTHEVDVEDGLYDQGTF